MALVKCRECGAQVSKKAAACPECGAPAKKKTSMFTWLVLVVIGAVIFANLSSPPDRASVAAPVVLTDEQKKAREAELVVELKTIPAAEVQKNLDGYRELAELNPANEKYHKKVAYYEEKMTRYRQIQAQFSAWSGAHKDLERYIKKRLKDPDSYEHIETGYNDNGDHIMVLMRYRAKNSFGGFALESVRARCTIEGQCTVL